MAAAAGHCCSGWQNLQRRILHQSMAWCQALHLQHRVYCQHCHLSAGMFKKHEAFSHLGPGAVAAALYALEELTVQKVG